MESSIAFQDQLSEAGRSDLSGTYWLDAEYSRDAVKHAEREKVLDFFLGYHEPLKVLSFPGISWTFEQMVRIKRKAQFIGLEQSKTIYYRSRCQMPGLRNSPLDSRHCLIEKTLKFGSGTILYSKIRTEKWGGKVTSFNVQERQSNRANRLLLMNSETYTNLFFDGYGATKKQRDEFSNRFYGRTAAWLDFTSQLCKSVELTLEKLPFCMAADDTDKPVAVTILNARDSFHGSDERIARILEIQPALKYQNHWTYIGKGGQSMLTACFTLR